MAWKIDGIHELALAQEDWAVEKEGEVLAISNDEGVDAFLYAGEHQIVVETVLFPLAAVKDVAALNTLILDTHQFLPLSTVGVNEINGEKYYVAFGALSTESKAEVLLEEIATLFANVPEFLELYAQHLKMEEVA